MTQPFDLQAFRDTFYQEGEDNRETENMLFELFIETADRIVAKLKSTIGQETEWSRAAHELKGAAANLKAGVLADLCKKAEYAPLSDAAGRQQLLQQIESEAGSVVAAIRPLMAD